MKQRFSSLDVRVIAHELSSALISLRIANIYDLSSRIFLFRCAKPGSREQLLVDSGFRCHLTSFTRTAASAPSVFVTRLRKYLKSRRITSVAQVGTDRVIEIVFSDGHYRLFLEFFAAGNIVLVDRELNVLALLRQVSEGDKDVDVKLGGKYSVETKQNFNGIPPLTKTRVRKVLETQVQRTKAATETGGKKSKRQEGGEDLRRAVSAGFSEYPAHLLDHAFKVKEFDASTKPEDVLGNEDLLTKLMVSIEYADEVFRSLGSSNDAQGYIIAKLKEKDKVEGEAPSSRNNEPSRNNILYDDFHPFRPSQFEGKPGIYILEISGFNKMVDEFYSSIESQKLESRLTEREEAAKRKLETAKAEHEKRVGALQHVQELHIRKAQAIEANTHRVEEVIAAVNGLIGQGMDWMDIAKLIENEQGRGNAVAQMVKLPLKLYENTVTLLLDEAGAEDEDEELDEGYNSEDEILSDHDQTEPNATLGYEKLSIDIDLALSPWANARQYYDQKKSAAVKEQKTLQASTRALKSTEKKIEADLKKGLKQETQMLRPARRKFFFENFLYFVSSDGYLVLGGKDTNQNELLYRRHLKRGDVYVHADLQGAASVIVKNKTDTPDAPIPPGTLSQAGALAVCTSSAWDSKAVMAAWWVSAEQVSKTVQGTGQYLQKEGDFAITGNKKFLPPNQLLLGFAVMWLIGEESRGNHNKLRLHKPDSQTLIHRNGGDLEQGLNEILVQGSEAGDSEHEKPGDVPDVEDAADEAKEVYDLNHSEKTLEGELEVDGNVSAAGSEADPDEERTNPLQTIGETQTDSPQPRTEDNGDMHDSDDEEEDEHGEEQEEDESSTSAQPVRTSKTPTTAQSQTSKTKTNKVPRGKRSKAARAAKKYAQQDEEDRALAMSLLGSTKQQQAKVDAEAERKEREEKLARDKERRRAQHDKAKRDEEKRAAGAPSSGKVEPTEQDQEVLAQEAADMANLDLLVPSLMPSDVIVAAIPVVAPWSALSRYKYKNKLQPGSVKKGKAVREIIGSWTSLAAKGGKIIDNESKDRERVWPGEVAKIKDWRFEEVVGVLPVKGVRVVQSGGNAGVSAAAAKGKGGGSGTRGGKGSKKAR